MKHFFVVLSFLSLIVIKAQSNPFPNDPGFTECFNNAKNYAEDPTFFKSSFGYSAPRRSVEPSGIWYYVDTYRQGPYPQGTDPALHRDALWQCQHVITPGSRDYSSSNLKALDQRIDSCKKSPGSIIDFEKRTVVEAVPVEGTKFALNYSSEFNDSIKANATIKSSFSLFSDVRSEYFVRAYDVLTNQLIDDVSYTPIVPYHFEYAIQPASGAWTSNTFVSSATILIKLIGVTDTGGGLCHWYYYPDPNDPNNLIYVQACGVDPYHESELESVARTAVLYHPQVWGMHGWTLSDHHFFDRDSKILFSGRGEKIQHSTFQTINDAVLGNVDVVINKYNENELFVFNSQGKHLETRHAILGYVIHKFEYDGNNRLISIKDRFNSATTLVYSGSNLQKIVSPFGVETTFQITSNRITKATDPEGLDYDMTYDSSDLLITYEPPTGVVTTFSYNSNGEFLQESKSNGLLQVFTKSIISGFVELTKSLNFGLDRKIQIVMTEEGVNTNEVNSNNNIIWQNAKSYTQNSTQFNFYQDVTTQNFTPTTEWGDDKIIVDQNVRNITESGQNITDTANYTETRTYTSGNVLKPVNYSNSLTTAASESVQNAYTKSNTTLLSTDPFGVQTTTKFSASGVVTRISSIDKYPVDFQYDALGRLIKAQKTSSYYETYGYDTHGYLATVNNSKSQFTQYIRNKKGQLLQKILPNSESIYFEYTNGGEIKKITAPNNQVHNFQLSLGDYITHMISPSSKTTVYDYDSDKRLSLVTKPSGQTLDYQYETGKADLKRIVTSSGTMTIGGRDLRSRITSMTSVDDIETDFTWASDQMQSQTWYDNGQLVATLSNNFATDQFKIQSISLNGNVIASYTYQNGILSGIDNLGFTYSHSFTTYDHTQTVTGGMVNVTYSQLDSASQPAQVITASIVDSALNPLAVTLRRNYDNFGQAISLISTKYNQNTSLYDGYYTLTPVYDSNSRLKQLTRVKKIYVGSTLTNKTEFVNKYTFTANSNNNVSGYSQTSGTTTTVTKQTSATYNIDDQLTQTTGTVSRTYTYTLDGEVSAITTASGTTTYQYDSFGYLKKATLPGGIVVEYKTDALNRRFKKLINGVTQEYYIWYDQTRLAAILDANKDPKLVYVYGAESTNTPGFVIKNGVTYKIIHDPGTESVRYVVSTADASVAQEIDYDEFGNVILNSDPSFQPLGFAGGLYDADTKLVRFGARDYDPVVSRWVSKDPIDFGGGDTNLYAYVGGNPMSFSDPNGEFALPLFLGMLFLPTLLDQPNTEALDLIITALPFGTTLKSVGLKYGEHALQRMAERGISEKMVETCMSKGIKYTDTANGSINYVLKDGFASGKSLLVAQDPMSLEIKTVIRGKNLIKRSHVPLK